MNADIRGALAQIDRSYKAFTHKGRCMTRDEVKKVLEYGLSKGYNHTGEFSDTEVDEILSAFAGKKGGGMREHKVELKEGSWVLTPAKFLESFWHERYPKLKKIISGQKTMLYKHPNRHEVIGNIYEHPHLIKKEAK